MSDPISSIVGGITNKNKASQEKRAIAESARIGKIGVDASLKKQGEMYDKNIGLYDPQLKSGQNIQNTYSYLMGLGNEGQNKYDSVNRDTGEFGAFNKNFTLSDFEQDPAYEFLKSEGQKALDRKASASGRYFSGAAAKDLAKYNQDYTNTSYDTARTRYNQDREALYSKWLTGLDNANETTANVANLNTGYGNTYSGLMTDRANIGSNAVMATSAAKGRAADANAALTTQGVNMALGAAGGYAGGGGWSGAVQGAINPSYGFGNFENYLQSKRA